MATKLWESLSPNCRVYDTYGVIVARDLRVVVCNVVSPSDVVKHHDNVWVQASEILGCFVNLACEVFGKHLFVYHLGVQ